MRYNLPIVQPMRLGLLVSLFVFGNATATEVSMRGFELTKVNEVFTYGKKNDLKPETSTPDAVFALSRERRLQGSDAFIFCSTEGLPAFLELKGKTGFPRLMYGQEPYSVTFSCTEGANEWEVVYNTSSSIKDDVYTLSGVLRASRRGRQGWSIVVREDVAIKLTGGGCEPIKFARERVQKYPDGLVSARRSALASSTRCRLY